MLLGLLKPNSGEILIDGVNISHQILEWRNSIGFIPQNIYLLDDTIISNIAFGIPKDEINMNNVERAIELAQVNEFIKELPEGL